MISEQNKTLIFIYDLKFCFHKLLKNNIQRLKCFEKICKSYTKLKIAYIIHKCTGPNRNLLYKLVNNSKLKLSVYNIQHFRNLHKIQLLDCRMQTGHSLKCNLSFVKQSILSTT